MSLVFRFGKYSLVGAEEAIGLGEDEIFRVAGDSKQPCAAMVE